MLPNRSPGVLLSPLTDRWVAYDLVTETTHHLNKTAGALLEACDGATDVDRAVIAWADMTGAEVSVVAADVERGLDDLADIGLVGRHNPFELTPRPAGCKSAAPEGSIYGQIHIVLGWAVQFRSTQFSLLAAIDKHLGTGSSESVGVPLLFDVSESEDGQVHLVSDEELVFPHLGSCLQHLTKVLNQYASLTPACVALHAGGVRTPAGAVVLLPGMSGAGKSTLTAALVAAGCDYLGDEAVGVRPISLTAVGYAKRLAIDASSRLILGLPASTTEEIDPADLRADVGRLGGSVGPVTRVVLTTFVEGAALTIEDLDAPSATDVLISNSFNLLVVGQDGLDTLCDLATSVPVQHMIHGDVHQAVSRLLTDTRSGSASHS